MKASLLTLLVITTGAMSTPADREARPASKSLLGLVQDAMRLAVDEAKHIYTSCIRGAFVGDDSSKNMSPHAVFASLPCNCVCKVCWKSPRDDLIEQCEDYCETSCGWNFRKRSATTHGGEKRALNLFEVCIGFGGSVGSGGDSGGGLLGGLLGGANPSQTKLNESVIADKTGLELPGKGTVSNIPPKTGNGSVESLGDLTRKLRADHDRNGEIIVELSDANIVQEHIDELIENVLEKSDTNVTPDLTQYVHGINKGLFGDSTADITGLLSGQFLGNHPDNASLEHALGENSDARVTDSTERLYNTDHDTISGFHEKPLGKTDTGLFSGQSGEDPRNYNTIVVSVEISPCNKGGGNGSSGGLLGGLLGGGGGGGLLGGLLGGGGGGAATSNTGGGSSGGGLLGGILGGGNGGLVGGLLGKKREEPEHNLKEG